MSKHDILQVPGQQKYPPSFSGSASESVTPKRFIKGLSLTVPDMLSKSRSRSLPAWQCWLPAELVSVSEADGHSTVVRGCSGMSRRKVHG